MSSAVGQNRIIGNKLYLSLLKNLGYASENKCNFFLFFGIIAVVILSFCHAFATEFSVAGGYGRLGYGICSYFTYKNICTSCFAKILHMQQYILFHVQEQAAVFQQFELH